MQRFLWAVVLVVACGGCWDALEKQVQKDPKSIIGKTTQEVGEFDPNKKQVVSDSKVKVDSPLLYGAQAYGPLVEQTSKLAIEHALNLFNATEGRYPKDHEEFMQRIIKENHIKLPVLPHKAKYEYDVENHQLVVVKAEETAE
jgi:hypothetical protein